MTISFTDRSIGKNTKLHESILATVSDVMISGSYVLGPHLEKLEIQLAKLCACDYAVGVNSGTDALILMLLALDIGPGHEVILPANVFHSVANAVCLTGARPVFCDVRYEDMLIDAEKVEPLITERTRAIIAVHLTGMPCDMDDINAIAKTHGLHVVEDAAQAVGAVYKNRMAGSLGIAGGISFHPLKNIHALGDGGAVVTSDPDLHQKLRQLRNHGVRDGVVILPGLNSRLDEIHAAALSIQLPFIEEIIDFKRNIALQYNESLRGYVGLNQEPKHKKGVYQLYMIKALHRKQLAYFLTQAGIEIRVHYREYVAFHPYYLSRFGKPKHLPVTERLSRQVISLPIYYGMDVQAVSQVISMVQEFSSLSSSH